MISSELPEILGMSDRILVMRGGRIVAEYSPEEANQEVVVTAMMSEASQNQAVGENVALETKTV